MSLLQALNLPLPKRFAPQGAAKAGLDAPPPPVGADAAGVHGTTAIKPPVDGKSTTATPTKGDPRLMAEARKLHGTIVAKREEARALLTNLDKLAPQLDKMIAGHTGDARKELEAKKAVLEKKTAEAVKTIDAANADLEALDNPQSRQEEVVKILAKHRAGGSRATEVDIQTLGLEPGTTRNHDVTTTITSYDKGKATVEKQRDQRSLGVDGYKKTTSTDKEVTSSTLTARSGEEKKTQVSITGKASVETKKTAEVELPDGRKAGIERTDAKEISLKGASHTRTEKKSNFDGSSTATTKKQAIERGDGKLTATSSTGTTTTNATGTATTRTSTASGGVVTGKDGVGAQAAMQQGKTVTTKGGRQAGVVGGLHANVLCNVGKPTGEPARYPVTVTVSFGASVAVSGGAGKQENSKASASVEIKGAVAKSMVVTHMLDAAELEDYVKALEAASKKGGKVSKAHKEFAIVSAGVNQSWEAARLLWQGDGAISKQTADTLKRSGDSVERGESTTKGLGVKANVGPVGGGVSKTTIDERSRKMTRNDQGGLDIDSKAAHTEQKSVEASLSVGVASARVGKVTTHKTSFGYSIQIDPKNDPDGKLLEWLGHCKSEMDYEMFIGVNALKIKVIGRTKGKSDAESTGVGVGVAGVELEIGTHQGIDEETTRDGQGKLTKKTVAGHAGAGGKLGPLADSVNEDAVAEIDGDGKATLTLTRTSNDNYGGRARDKRLEKLKAKVGMGGKKPDGSSGDVTKAGGEEDDNEVRDVSGLKLSNKELRRIGASVCRSPESFIDMRRRVDERDDLKKAAAAIKRGKGAPAVVAEELARFIGGDRVERMKTVELYLRGGHSAVKIGQAFEWPDGLAKVRDDYEAVTADSLPAKLDALAVKDPAKAIAECKRLSAIAETVDARIRGNGEFSNHAVKSEMLGRLYSRRQQLTAAIDGYAGKDPHEDPKFLETKRQRLVQQCSTFSAEQEQLRRKLAGILDGDKKFLVRDLGDARPLIRQLEDLQNRWGAYFGELIETMTKLGVPNFDVPMLKPNPGILEFFEKAAER